MKKFFSKKHKFCCDMMKHYSTSEYSVSVDGYIHQSTLLHCKKKKYGIVIQDGGGSYVQIKFCPWCGQKL